ncbi:MAG: ClpXP protease specificity-enhancing factor [Oleispira antarctica]|nr:ClpXP protease specificity-enhancing factor [Oleispira antarctica]MBQ0793841.1 ClpXP protease specificity-enhancing factor [Oleispira antarctica]
MTPSRPYLMRALNEWILENDCTPYVLVDAGMPGVQVPEDYIDNGQIVLNISMSAVKSLLIDDDGLSFNARFGGVPIDLYVPMVAILAIYAKENGQGMVFGSEAGAPDPNKPPEPPEPTKPKRDEKPVKPRPSLKVVK